MEKENANQMFPVNGLRICVDAGGEDVTGRVYTPLLEDGMAFAGLQEMFLKADRIFDKAGYPEAMQQKRTFKKRRDVSWTAGAGDVCRGDPCANGEGSDLRCGGQQSEEYHLARRLL